MLASRSSARLSSSAHRLGSSARPLPRIARLPVSSTREAGRYRVSHRRAGGCLLVWRSAVGGSIIAVVVVCLLASGRRAARSFLVPLIGSSNRQGIGYGSAHPIGSSPHRRRCAVGFLFFSSFPLTPSCRLFSACLPGACSPVPGRGMCGPGRGLRRRVWGLVCLLAIVSVSLTRSRSFARCYMPRLVALRCPIWGVVGRFAGYSARLPVGVGVFQYMPLNRILWLLTGIFGDGVRCPFSALPAGPSSSLRHASCPLPAAVSWRLCGRFLW